MNNSILLENISVAFRMQTNRSSSLKESILRIMKGGVSFSPEDFYALKNLSLSIPCGSTLGIIGSNGSGKSTLLKVISGVLSPSQGHISVNGTLSSLIELGVGFDPELTAVENIFLHGSLYKRSASETAKRLNHIIDFAELREFKDQPIKHFSSGMVARLGFSAAIDINPDILVVDEILAVGDERFQQKCNQVFEDYKASGKTIIMVSHDLELIRKHCQTVALLSCGELIFEGAADEALQIYRSGNYHTRLSA